MGHDFDLDPDPGGPLALSVRPGIAPAADLRCLRFEFSSRGDRVPGRLLLPGTRSGRAPLVLLEHGARGALDAPYLDATAVPWVRAGAGVASIDLPLHGARTSGKLSERLLAGLAPAPGGRPGWEPGSLWREFARQAVADLRRALDALASLDALDPARIAYAAFSLGSLVGTLFCAVDERPRAAALALAGGGLGPAELDPARFVARIAPRPLLLVNARQDARIPRAAAEALFHAAGEPKQQLWFEGGHGDLPGAALKSMWGFLRSHLGLSADDATPGAYRPRRTPASRGG